MENVVLVIHLILALTLIGTVLLQRSEGGGLGMGGGGGGGATGSRPAPTAMGRVTWILALGFIATSIALTIIAAENAAGASVVDRLQDAPLTDPATPAAPGLGDDLLPPSAGDAGLTPTGNDTAPATTPAAPDAATPMTPAPAAPADPAPDAATPSSAEPAAPAAVPDATAPATPDAAPATGDVPQAPAGN